MRTGSLAGYLDLAGSKSCCFGKISTFDRYIPLCTGAGTIYYSMTAVPLLKIIKQNT
jgi:hypothetical protein